ncbi:MAG: hypothetical protein K6F48_03080 [Paludibacteraceae bacterium]|nr:hypothetical protein [Paludibacteraceae bacterium]
MFPLNKNTTDGTDKFVTTYYVRDPQGNVLAVYEHKHGESDNGTFTLTEQHLYGAGRLGMRKRDLALNVANASEPTPAATHYELTNHLGNVMAVISDEASTTDEPTVVSLSDYYPYGMTEPGRSWNSGDYRFGYTGHEKESDLAEGVYTTEYRLLDTRLGKWLSVDPLAEEASDWSPYRTSFDNPLIFVDPDGQWEADSKGNLIAEKGDHAGTLAKFLNISFEDALKKLKDQGYTVNDKGILNLEVGDKVKLNNVFTRSIRDFVDGTTEFDYYNCWGSAIAGSQGKKIWGDYGESKKKQNIASDKEASGGKKFIKHTTEELVVGVGIAWPWEFDKKLEDGYYPTTKGKAQFGKTVLRFVYTERDANGKIIKQERTHGAVYYGKNHAGEIYIYTKNGWEAEPKVMKLKDLENKVLNIYGTIYGKVTGGVFKNDSGYYNPKSK